MQIEPVINARFKQFRKSHELEEFSDGDAFERFVNYTIFTLHQPDAFNSDSELLDFVCVGGRSDMGIDGLAIKVNGILIKTKDDIDDIIKRFKRIDVEFIFIQSKYKPKFNKGELNNFVDGVRDFLSDENHFPMNEKVKKHFELKEYILSDDVIIIWDSNPKVSLYYVAMGRWKNAEDLVGVQKHFENDIQKLNVYEGVNFHFIDSQSLKDIYDSIQNTFSKTIDSRHTMPLTDVEEVNNSCMAIVYASEFLKLISTDDGVIRKSLFNDNVRDFQGINSVNSEIFETIEKNPEKFIILNNGITIVCDEFKQNNTKLSISNPQIVNGCQTSHVIFEAHKRGKDISKVPISIKFISTTNNEVVNTIVRGTNRQNIVLEEAFETTKDFHKDLEEVFRALSQELENDNVYYERRSKQYLHNPTIKHTQKVNLRVLTQYFVGMFLNSPHDAHRHESTLLKDYSNSIYQDSHSKLPYFTTAIAFLKLERLVRGGKMTKSIKSYKPHILMMLRESISGFRPNLHHEKSIDNHCNAILKSIDTNKKSLEVFSELNQLFDNAMKRWEELGKSRRGTKDVENFTNHLLNIVREHYNHQKGKDESIKHQEEIYTGKVINIIRDKFGGLCGFIKRNPENIFFHSRLNKNLNISGLKDKLVSYKVEKHQKTGREHAIEVKEIKYST